MDASSAWRLLAVPVTGGLPTVLQSGQATPDGHIDARGTIGVLAPGQWDLHLELVLLGGQAGTSDVHRIRLP